MEEPANVTELLQRARAGDEEALRALFEATYGDLRNLARARLRRAERDALLDTTSLVHESFVRFAEAGSVRIEDRAHFLRYACQVMRSVIVDFVRERMTQRRGGATVHVTLTTDSGGVTNAGETEILRIHEALEQLARHDTRMVEVVEMRYFGGMTENEVAEALGVTARTVRRDWEKARVLLAAALK